MNIELNTAFTIIQAVSIIGGGGFLLYKVGRAWQSFEAALNMQNVILKNQAEDVTELKADVRSFKDILSTMAVQEHRIDRLEADFRELRHGRGFIQEP